MIKIPRSPTKCPRSPTKGPRSPRSPRSQIGEVIVMNPLRNIINTISKNPSWCCKHEGIQIINYEEKMFRCLICNKGKIIKRYYQKEILSALSSEADK
jgi:hypothetical protein